jgi:hypothetical protein
MLDNIIAATIAFTILSALTVSVAMAILIRYGSMDGFDRRDRLVKLLRMGRPPVRRKQTFQPVSSASDLATAFAAAYYVATRPSPHEYAKHTNTIKKGSWNVVLYAIQNQIIMTVPEANFVVKGPAGFRKANFPVPVRGPLETSHQAAY